MTRDEAWLLREKWNGEKTDGFFADCARLAAGEPLAYVIGHVPFLDTTIYLDSHPLIPRAETEFWLRELILDISSPTHPNFRGLTPKVRVRDLCLDLCAGSGCIGVAIARAFPEARVDFVEIDPRHHPVIAKNIRENGIDPSRTRILGGDLFTQVTDSYDLILGNPPYIDRTLDRTDAAVIEYEPHEALFADDGGFALIGAILRNAPRHLTPSGTLVIEHEPEHASRIEAYARTHDLLVRTLPDQYGTLRVSVITLGHTPPLD